jgi:hypothetical protein
MIVRQWMRVIVPFCLIIAFAGPLPAAAPESAGAAPGSLTTIPELPCAETRKRYVTDALTVLYPAPELYLRGAILPTKEGLACLDVFTDWLKNVPSTAWQVTVGGETGTHFDPQALADKRLELLQRYFLRRGIDTASWTWRTVAWRVNGREVQMQFKGSP